MDPLASEGPAPLRSPIDRDPSHDQPPAAGARHRFTWLLPSPLDSEPTGLEAAWREAKYSFGPQCAGRNR